MQIVLYMAITANGYIATLDDDTPWSSEEWEEYLGVVTKQQCLIIGRRTYQKSDKHQLLNFNMPVLVISKKLNKPNKNLIFINSINQAINFIKKNKLNKIMIAGGAKINNEFMKRNLINEIYLDVEPFIFGQGIPLLFPDNYKYNLKFLSSKMLNKNTIQLHYCILQTITKQ